MTVEETREVYLRSAYVARVGQRCPDVFCGLCRWAYLRLDAASIAYDLAIAEATRRAGVGAVS